MLCASMILYAQKWDKVTVTVYNPTKGQCDSKPLITASLDVIPLKKLKAGKLRWLGLSRDLLKKYPIKSRIFLWIEPGHPFNGVWYVADKMNARFTNYVDILTYSQTTGKWTGKIRHLK